MNIVQWRILELFWHESTKYKPRKRLFYAAKQANEPSFEIVCPQRNSLTLNERNCFNLILSEFNYDDNRDVDKER
jgi:hypothetical protein